MSIRKFLQHGAAGLLWLLPAVAALGQEAPLTPGQVAALAARQSFASTQAVSDSMAAAADVRHARSTWYPTVDFQGQYITRDNQPEITAGPLTFPMGNQSNGEFSLTARELLWNGGQRGLAVKAARHNLASVRAAGLSRIQNAQLDALARYLDAMNLQGQAGVLDRSLASLDKHLQEARDLYDHGLVARNDLLETRVRRDQVRDARAAVDDRLAVVLQDLNRMLGRDPLTPVTLPDTLAVAFEPQQLAPGDPDTLLAGNLRVRAAAEAEHTARVLADLARRAWLPNVFAAASHTWQDNDALVYPHVNSLAVGVSWNLFDGGARTAGTAKAEAATITAARACREAERAARVAFDQARRALEQARREEATAHASVAAAAENLRIVSDQYRQGLARSSDVLDAEALLAQSRLQALVKHHDGILAAARLAAVTGRDPASIFTDTAITAQGSDMP